MQMTRAHYFLVAAFLVSYLGAMSFKLLGGPRDVAFGIALPALVVSGWAAFGHLITLDDDFPGEWSNPEGSWRFLAGSLAELLVKVAVFGLLLLVLAL